MPLSQQSGFTFPPIVQGPQGRVNYVHNNTPRLIRDSIIQILLTVPGERWWNPAFGCRIHSMLFEPASPIQKAMTQNLVYEALKQWEPRITVRASDIAVTFNSGAMIVRIPYRILKPDTTGSDTGSVQVSFVPGSTQNSSGAQFMMNDQFTGTQLSINDSDTTGEVTVNGL